MFYGVASVGSKGLSPTYSVHACCGALSQDQDSSFMEMSMDHVRQSEGGAARLKTLLDKGSTVGALHSVGHAHEQIQELDNLHPRQSPRAAPVEACSNAAV